MGSLEEENIKIKREEIEKLKNYKHKLIDELIKLYIYEEVSEYVDEVYNTDKNDFRKLSKLKCLDISSRDYLIVKLMEQYRKHLDKETVKEEFFKKVCRRYDLKV